jgi:hypothetical protein
MNIEGDEIRVIYSSSFYHGCLMIVPHPRCNSVIACPYKHGVTQIHDVPTRIVSTHTRFSGSLRPITAFPLAQSLGNPELYIFPIVFNSSDDIKSDYRSFFYQRLSHFKGVTLYILKRRRRPTHPGRKWGNIFISLAAECIW